MVYSRSRKVGNPIASILQGNVYGIPALFGLNSVSNLRELTLKQFLCTGIIKMCLGFSMVYLRASIRVFRILSCRVVD